MDINRRNFFKGMAAASTLPLFNIGCAGFGQGRRAQLRRGAKLRIALIGCGAEGRCIAEALFAEELVAIVDPDPAQLAIFGLKDNSGKRDVDFGAAAREQLAKVRRYCDYRVMFDEIGDELDAIVIETPNHHHALPALMAIRRGIAVYLDKPMTLTWEEADILGRESAANPDVTTQVGTFGHSFYTMPYCVGRIREGAIGDVTDVWCYDDRLNSMMFRPQSAPPPKGMDWDVWCGGSPVCDYYPTTKDYNGIHPHDWHSWIGYGNGAIGNMGTHIMDCAFWALELDKTEPYRIDTKEAEFACPGAWAWRDTFTFHFPEHGAFGPVKVHWYDGVRDGIPYTAEYVNKWGQLYKRENQNLPPIVTELEQKYNCRFWNHGFVMVGTKGAMFYSHHGAFRFLPDERGGFREREKNFSYPKMTCPHVKNFFDAVREGRAANNPFDYNVPLAKTVMLGNVAARAGRGTLLWDGHRVTNKPSANEFLRTDYRAGWEVI